MVVTGNAAAVNAVKLVARVEGYLDKIHYQDGQFVKKDDLLFTIQQDQYKDQLQQAQAQVLAAQAALIYAKTELVRYSKLVKQDAATQTTVDEYVYKKASAEAQLLGAQAQVALAKLNLIYTEVRAPFDGIVGKHLIDPGNLVGGGGQQSALAEITQLDPIYAIANLSEQNVLKIRANLGQHRLTLADLRELCDRYGSVLIFDEVMTGFRLHFQGAQGLYGVVPDLTTLGKVIGGGMPVGAFGGRRDIMEKIAPLGPVYQAGTLSGNPVAVAAGLATLRAIQAPEFYQRLSERTRALTDGLTGAAARAGIAFSAQSIGGMFGIYFAKSVPDSFTAVMSCDKERFNRFFHSMLDAGVYLAPSTSSIKSVRRARKLKMS